MVPNIIGIRNSIKRISEYVPLECPERTIKFTINPNVEDGMLIQFSIPRKGMKAVSIPKMDIIAQIQRIRSNILRDPRIDMIL